MSEFMEQWNAGLSVEEHSELAQQAHRELNDYMYLPADGRIAIAHGMPMMGGRHSLAYLQGDQGTGKTDVLTRIMGFSHRHNLEAGDTAETLFGYPNPINRNEMISGSLEEELLSDDQRAALNELPHIANTGPLHDFAENQIILPGNRVVDIRNLAFMATGNYPDGRRSKDFDAAMRSRLFYVPMGDMPKDQAEKLQGRDVADAASNNYRRDGLIPAGHVRQDIREKLQAAIGVDKRVGKFILATLDLANGTELLVPVHHGDGRIGKVWQTAERARRLVTGTNLHAPITPEDLSDTAALRLGGLYRLNEAGENYFEDRLRLRDGLTPKEKQTIINRMLAATALLGLRQIETASEAEKRRRNQSGTDAEILSAVMAESSFFDGGDQTEAIDEAIIAKLTGEDSPHEKLVTPTNPKFFSRFIPRRKS